MPAHAAATLHAAAGSVDPRPGQAPRPEPAPADALAQRAAPRHQLLKLLGKGGMGEVYAAFDPELRRKVAFKRLLPEWTENTGMSARFLTEVQVTAQLDHPNVVPVNGFELAEDGTLGYSMKLIKGRDLSKLMDKWRVEAATLSRVDAPRRLASRIDIFLRICEAMTYAHGKGVLHRDLKPENVMVGLFNDVYVMDWGIFRLIGDPAAEERVTMTPEAVAAAGHGKTLEGAVLGTPGYMSPEQAQGKIATLDERSDVFTLGVILAELVTLRPARATDNLDEALGMARRGFVPPLVHANPHLPISRDLKAIVAHATALDPAARYPTAKALADDLRRFLRGEATRARPDNPVQKLSRFLARHRMATLAIILGLLAVGGAVVAWQIRARSQAEEAALVRHNRHQALAVAVARHADALDARLAQIQVAASRLVGRVSEAITTLGVADPATRLYLAPDFDGPAGPPGRTFSPRYQRQVSLDNPVIQLAPGTEPTPAVLGQARRLVGLRAPFMNALLASDEEATMALTDAAARTRLIETGVPVLRAFATLASGVHLSYPGYGGYEPDYDGRKRKKYTSTLAAATGIHRVTWGEPYADRHGLGLVVPVAGVLFDRGEVASGVAGLELSLVWLAERWLPIASAPWVTDVALLDGKGQALVVVPTGAAPTYPEVSAPGESGTVNALAFAHARAAKAVADDEVGVVELPDGRLAAVYPLSTLDATMVLVADPARMPSGR